MQSIGLPGHILAEINRLFFSFIWKKKYTNKKAFEKVKRNIITQDFDKGGLKMIDMQTLQKSLYISWIPKLLSEDPNPTWKAIPMSYLNELGGSDLKILDNPCRKKQHDRGNP